MSNIAGAGEEGREGWKEGTCFPVFQCLPYLPPPLIFGIGSLNTKWGILYQHQYAESGL